MLASGNVAMLHNYLQLRARVDRFVDSVVARYSDQVRCRAGCATCCTGGLTVVAVEAAVVGRALGLKSDVVFLQAGQPPLRDGGFCALLNGGERCSIYEDRPLTCRIQGMPLQYPNADELSVCPMNFTGLVPHRSAAFNMQNLETALFAVNLDFCKRLGVQPASRIALDRIAALARAATPAP